MIHEDYAQLMLVALAPVALVACWYDFRWHRVPNWLNAIIAVTGLGTQAAVNGWMGFGLAVQGMLVGFGMLIMLWIMNGMGAGDVKLMAALGTWLGPQMAFYAVLVGGLLGGVIAVGMILYRRNWIATAAGFTALFAKLSYRDMTFDSPASNDAGDSNGMLPYAIPLSVGTLLVVVSDLSGWWSIT